MYNNIDEVPQERQDIADEYFNGEPCEKCGEEERKIVCLYCYKRIFCDKKEKVYEKDKSKRRRSTRNERKDR